ncbi:MAG: hypothetical protein IKE43_08660 [Coriobacteriales bacterium]|nr:hypothetical protein [Coriobacteriales bacterium]
MILPIALDILSAIVQMCVLVAAIRLLGRANILLPVAFFTFALACVLLSTLYWITFDIIQPGMRMPFAANQIGELALFLLLAVCLKSVIPLNYYGHGAAVIATTLFAVANIALWIAWSGEWVQDILGGIPFGYLLCITVLCLRQSEALTYKEQAIIGVLCMVLIITQTSIFFAPDTAKHLLDLFCYSLLFFIGACIILRALHSLRTDSPPAASLSLAFASYAWMTTAMYMSDGGFYLVAFALVTLCFPLMLHALRKVVTAP